MIVWLKHEPADKIWWMYNSEKIGEFAFSFDKKNIFYLFRDYEKMTKKQKEIFDKENPYWKKFFSGEN